MNDKTKNILIGVALGYLAAKYLPGMMQGSINGQMILHTKQTPYTIAVAGRGWTQEQWKADPPTIFTRVNLTT